MGIKKSSQLCTILALYVREIFMGNKYWTLSLAWFKHHFLEGGKRFLSWKIWVKEWIKKPSLLWIRFVLSESLWSKSYFNSCLTSFFFFFLPFRFWFFKFATALAISVGAFFIPEGPFTTGKRILPSTGSRWIVLVLKVN